MALWIFGFEFTSVLRWGWLIFGFVCCCLVIADVGFTGLKLGFIFNVGLI